MVAPPLKEAEEQVRVKVEKEKRIREKIGRERAKKLSKRYNKQYCYLIQLYDPRIRVPVGVIPVRTEPTLKNVLKDLEEKGFYPLILPQPVYIPQSFKSFKTFLRVVSVLTGITPTGALIRGS